MPTLNWIGKEAVVKHHKDVPFRLLEPVAELSCSPRPQAGITSDLADVVGQPSRMASSSSEGLGERGAATENLIVQGDNLDALKALLPRYAGQVKCIYIDPPYNTGNEGWVYNDNVNSAEIKRWLGEVVGREGETLDRHDRWLCMMYPRLLLLNQFLRDDGAIFVSIDDNEVATLRLLMDEIFGAGNFVAQLVWKARQHLDSRALSGVSTDHEYILLYSKIAGKCRLKGKDRDEGKYANPDNDTRGVWMSRSILGLANAKDRPNLHYDLIDPSTGVAYPCASNTGWRYSRETMANKLADGRILFPKKVTGRPCEKVFLKDLQTSGAGFPSVIDGIYTADGSQALRDIFGQQEFAFPKAPELVQSLIAQATDKDSLILDSFAGSGTTGHAVLKQNAEDGGNRRFILVEMDEHIARNVTAERVRRVSEGYSKGKSTLTSTLSQGEREENWVEGLGGGFQFCTLSKQPLFTAEGQIREDVSYAQLAEFVWFVETGTGLKSPLTPLLQRGEKMNVVREFPTLKKGGEGGISPLLGIHQGRAIYLLYNGILKDKSVAGGNVLTSQVFDLLEIFDGSKVIYAAACRLGAARLQRENIVFKQTPLRVGGINLHYIFSGVLNHDYG